MTGLSLLVPTSNAKPDYTVFAEGYILQLRADWLFKSLAIVSKQTALEKIREYVHTHHDIDPVTITAIVAFKR